MARTILAICSGIGVLSWITHLVFLTFGLLPPMNDSEESTFLLFFTGVAGTIGLYYLANAEYQLALVKTAANVVHDNPDAKIKSISIEQS